MDKRQTLLNIIHKHSTLVAVGIDKVDETDIMYDHASTDEMRDIIAEMEKTFGVILFPPDRGDIGEMTVKDFVDGILEVL